MDAKYFTNPELSKILQDRGLVSQFHMGWKDGLLVDMTDSIILKTQPTYHFSDLLLYSNAVKIWPEGSTTTGGCTIYWFSQGHVLLLLLNDELRDRKVIKDAWKLWLNEQLLK